MNADNNEALTIDVGEGGVKFAGAVGGVSPLGFVTISSANNIDADSTFASAGITADALTATTPVSTPLINFDGLITSTGAVTLNATDINILGGVTARGQNVTLDAGTSGVEISGGAINTSGVAFAVTGGLIDIDSEGDVVITGVDSDLITSGVALVLALASLAVRSRLMPLALDRSPSAPVSTSPPQVLRQVLEPAVMAVVRMDTANQTITLNDTVITTSGGRAGGPVGAGGEIHFGSDG